MALPARLRPDCLHCAALCCVAPPFDAAQGFGYDKPAAQACRNLQDDNRCAIHASLSAQGFPGCTGFDCFGAGQRVTQMFAEQTWRDSPELARRMFDAYARLRPLHELQAMATLALGHATAGTATVRLQEILAGLEHLCEIDEHIDAVALRRQTEQQIRDVLSPQGSA